MSGFTAALNELRLRSQASSVERAKDKKYRSVRFWAPKPIDRLNSPYSAPLTDYRSPVRRKGGVQISVQDDDKNSVRFGICTPEYRRSYPMARTAEPLL